MNTLPIIYSVHHASDSFDFAGLDERCALTPEQRTRFSDFGSRDTVPRNGVAVLGTHSRGIVDLNRSHGDPTLFPEKDFGRDERRAVWIPHREPTDEERALILDRIYRPYHERLETLVLGCTQPTLLVAWDNTAPYEDFFDQRGHIRTMPSVIISNNGDRNVGTAAIDAAGPRITTCEPALLETLKHSLERRLRDGGLPHDVEMNTYDTVPNDECGYIANRYNSLREGGIRAPFPVQSLQVEYSTNLTHDATTLTPDVDAIRRMREAFEGAFADVAETFLR